MTSLIIVRMLKRQSEITLKLGVISFLCIEFIVLFEIVLPLFSTTYTSDFLDAIMYILGSIAFYFLQFLSPKNKSVVNYHLNRIK